MPTVLIKDHEESEENESSEFHIEKGETLYEGLEKKGKTLPHGCLAGSCGACKVVILENPQNLEKVGIVERSTLTSIYNDNPHIRKKTIRLSCRSRIKGSVTLAPFPLKKY